MEAFRVSGSIDINNGEKAAQDLGKLSQKVNQTQKELDAGEKKARSFDGALGSLAGVVGKVAAASAVFATTWKQAMALGKEGAEIQQTGESFRRLTVNLGGSADMLDRLREASRGTVDDLQLMRSTTALLSGTSGDLSKSLLDATPQLLEMAKAANKLNPTLGDTTYMYESLALGIKRGSPLILDNLGITVSIEQANRAYAASLGVAVDALTKEQQQQALLNAVLDKGNILVQQAGGQSESAADAFMQLQAASKNLSDAFKVILAPGLTSAANAMVTLLTANQRVKQAVITHAKDVQAQAAPYEEYRAELIRAAKAAGYLVDAEGNLIKAGRTSGGVVKTIIQERYLQSEADYYAQRAVEAHADSLDRWERQAVRAQEASGELAVSDEELAELTTRAKEAREDAAAAVEDYARALDAAQEAARGEIVAQSQLAETLKGATNADLAKAAISQLTEALQAGEIPASAYTAAVQDVQLAYGLASEKSLALSENIGLLSKAAGEGVIAPEQLSEALGALNQDAADGEVNLQAILEKFGATSEKAAEFASSAKAVADENARLAEQTGKISEKAGSAAETLGNLDKAYEGNAKAAESTRKATEDYIAKLDDLKARVEALNGKKATVTVNVVQNGSLPATPKPKPEPGESGYASGVDFIVPAGYPHDSYPIRAQSGERVIILPAGERSSRGAGGLTLYGNLTIVQQGGDVRDTLSSLSRA